MMFSLDVHERAHGPLFNGTADNIIDHGCTEAEKDVAEHAEDRVRAQLGRVLRHPTGRYMSRIHTVRRGGMSEVNDRDSVYGPWLEGTGSRNRTTRFKGYHTFRLVGQRTQRDAERLADPALDRAVRRL